MTLQVADTHKTGVLTVRQTHEMGSSVLYLDHDEQCWLLEALARIQGFTLVDHTERVSLLALAEEVEEARGPFGIRNVAEAGVALAAAVSLALRVEQEV